MSLYGLQISLTIRLIECPLDSWVSKKTRMATSRRSGRLRKTKWIIQKQNILSRKTGKGVIEEIYSDYKSKVIRKTISSKITKNLYFYIYAFVAWTTDWRTKYVQNRYSWVREICTEKNWFSILISGWENRVSKKIYNTTDQTRIKKYIYLKVFLGSRL